MSTSQIRCRIKALSVSNHKRRRYASKLKACTNPKEKDFDRRRHGAFIRQNARKSKPQLVQGMIKAALRQGFDCSYVLMDSWFNYEPLLKWIISLDLDVIGMHKLDHRSYHRLDRKERSVTYKLSRLSSCGCRSSISALKETIP